MTEDHHPSGPPTDPAAAGSPPAGDSDHALPRVLSALRAQIDSLERIIEPGLRARPDGRALPGQPSWRRRTRGEARVPVSIAVAVAIVLQAVLPVALVVRPGWLLPALEGALLVGLTVADPRRIERDSRLLRGASLVLIAVISAANAWSAAKLVSLIIAGTIGSNAETLIGSGAAIYLTNIIVFGLWYWEFDRGGPAARAHGANRYPDFMFVQMDKTEMAPPEWKPNFMDYLWLSFTNATAFSPTDTMPLTRTAKAIMLAQAAISLTTVSLVVARAVNIFK